MKLEDFASDLVGGKKFVKAAFAGFAGAGKSRTATEFAIGAYHDLGLTKPAMIVDNEEGSRFLVPAFRNGGVRTLLKSTTSLEDVLTAIDFLNAGEIDLLFMDSLTKVWYRYIREYLKKNRKVFMGLDDWGKVLPAWQEIFSDKFVAAQGSIIFTGRGGFEYEKEEDEYDEETGKTKKGAYVRSGVKMKMAGETPFEPDLNVWMAREDQIGREGLEVWREGLVMKDRSGTIDGKTFKNPTYEEFRPFVRFILDVPEGQIKRESSTRSLAPGENYEGYQRKNAKEIALEEIEAELVKQWPGQAQVDKRAKADTLEKLFGTRSWKAVESLSLEKLQEGRNTLWLEIRGHRYGEQPPVQPEQPLPTATSDDDKIPFDPPAETPAAQEVAA